MTDEQPSPSNEPRYVEFGEQIERSRRQREYIRSRVAEVTRVQVSHYVRIERGIILPSLITFASIWRCLRFDITAALNAIPANASEPETKRPPSLRELAAHTSNIGRKLARARVDANLTQQNVASALGVATRHIAQLESGHKLPSLSHFARLHQTLDLDVERLLGLLLGDIPDEPFRGLGNKIRAVRTNRGLTVHDVAQVLNCPLLRYRRLESGEFLPSLRELALLHKLLRYDANDVMQWLWNAGAIHKR